MIRHANVDGVVINEPIAVVVVGGAQRGFVELITIPLPNRPLKHVHHHYAPAGEVALNFFFYYSASVS